MSSSLSFRGEAPHKGPGQELIDRLSGLQRRQASLKEQASQTQALIQHERATLDEHLAQARLEFSTDNTQELRDISAERTRKNKEAVDAFEAAIEQAEDALRRLDAVSASQAG